MIGSTALASEAYEYAEMWMPLDDVFVGRVEERVDTHPGLRHESDRMHHAVELVALADLSGYPVGEGVQVLLVLHIELDQRRLLRQPVGDALNQPQPVEAGQHQLGPRSWATRAM